MKRLPQIALLPDGKRLHLQDGPIDLVVEARSDEREVRAAYDAAVADVEAGRFAQRMRDVTFSLDEFHRDIDGYNHKLEGVLNGN